MKNKLKIIGGEWRSRIIDFPDIKGLRPTPARVRETLFNWLQYDIAGSHCLDLYAGSGALGFEAASRGAGRVTVVECNTGACKALQDNALKLSAEKIVVIQSDVAKYLSGIPAVNDIVFMDPPFGQGLVEKTCRLLEQNGWLSDTAKIYVETETGCFIEGLPDNWKLLKNKTAGEVAYHLFERMV